MIVSLIVAASDNEVIGAGGELPWHLPGDMRRFRALTMGHVVVMGRVTYASIVARLGRPLPGRTSVVVSAASGAGDPAQVRWAGSLEEALRTAGSIAAAAGDQELFIAGGVSVYSGALPLAGRVYLTRVHAVVEGDRTLPPGWLDGFELVRREAAADPGAALPYEWLDYRRAAR